MKFPATLDRLADGRWRTLHHSTDWGRLESVGETPEQATEKLCREIRYRLELCPCSGEMYRDVHVEVVGGSRD